MLGKKLPQYSSQLVVKKWWFTMVGIRKVNITLNKSKGWKDISANYLGSYNLSNTFGWTAGLRWIPWRLKKQVPFIKIEFDDLLPVSLLGFGQPPTNTQFSHTSNNPKYPNHSFTISWLSNFHIFYEGWLKTGPPIKNGRLILSYFLPLGRRWVFFRYFQAIPHFHHPKISEFSKPVNGCFWFPQ